jgi:hypothetical protein
MLDETRTFWQAGSLVLISKRVSMKPRVWWLLVSVMVVAACKSSTDKNSDPSSDGGNAGDAAGEAGVPSVAGVDGGGAGNEAGGTAGSPAGGTSGTSSDTGGAETAGMAGSNSESSAPSCSVPTTVLGSCEKKDLNGKLKSCTVYWGSAFTPDTLSAGCPTIIMGQNVCPAASAVGACETSEGPTALANYYYEAAAGTPANQAQCNMNTGHVWCTP